MYTYVYQTYEYKTKMVMNFLNIYNLLDCDPNIFYPVSEAVALAICGIVLFCCVYKKTKFNNEQIITLGLWFLIVMTFVLPGMHDRYLYVGEVLALIYLLIYKKNYGVTCFVIFSPLLTYSKFLFEIEIENVNLLVITYLILIIIFTINIFKLLALDNDC